MTLLKLTALKNRGKAWQSLAFKLIFHSCIPFDGGKVLRGNG